MLFAMLHFADCVVLILQTQTPFAIALEVRPEPLVRACPFLLLLAAGRMCCTLRRMILPIGNAADFARCHVFHSAQSCAGHLPAGTDLLLLRRCQHAGHDN